MRRRSRQTGMTLIELMFVTSIMLMLSGMLAGGFFQMIRTVYEVKCMNNLKTMARALETYKMNQLAYPPDYPEPDLKQLLGKHVDNIEAEFIFQCPVQPEEPLDRMRNVIGYDEFYIEKRVHEDIPGMINLVINCPHHGDDNLTLLMDGSVERAVSAPVGHSVSGGLYPGQIAVGGELLFNDGVQVNFEAQQCANYIMSLERTLGNEGIHNSCDDVIRLLPGEIGDFHVSVPAKSRLCVITCVATLRIDGKKPSGIEVDLTTGYGYNGGGTPRAGPYTLTIKPLAGTNGKVQIRKAPQTEIEGPNPVRPGDTTHVVDLFENPQLGGRCTPPAPVD